MGNEIGKGKYAKMDKVEVASSSSDLNSTTNKDKTSSYVTPDNESKRSPISTITSLKQGINSGYHSIALSPKSQDNEDSSGSIQSENIE